MNIKENRQSVDSQTEEEGYAWGECENTGWRIRWVRAELRRGVGGEIFSEGKHDDEEAVIRGKLGGVKF
jgi:hypothetical protein